MYNSCYIPFEALLTFPLKEKRVYSYFVDTNDGTLCLTLIPFACFTQIEIQGYFVSYTFIIILIDTCFSLFIYKTTNLFPFLRKLY